MLKGMAQFKKVLGQLCMRTCSETSRCDRKEKMTFTSSLILLSAMKPVVLNAVLLTQFTRQNGEGEKCGTS